MKDSAERLNMKENPRMPRTIRPAKTVQPHIASRDNLPDDFETEDVNLSPETVQAKVSTPSKVLIRMLEGYDTVHYTRHWGINE